MLIFNGLRHAVLEMLMQLHAAERCILVKERSFIFICRFSILTAATGDLLHQRFVTYRLIFVASLMREKLYTYTR